MVIPPQGFRHAVDLLLRNGARRRPVNAEQLANDLVALGDDMHAPPGFGEWVAAEYQRVLHCPAPDVLRAFGATWSPEAGRRDFFLIYVPEDRLSIAGPLAVELAKRRLSVAFSEYEVASRDELDAAVARGLACNRAGALLVTPEFGRKPWHYEPNQPRLWLLRDHDRPVAMADQLATWLSSQCAD